MIKAIGRFKYKCICLWSKDDEYGFIPFQTCPIHGKSVRKMLKNTVECILPEEKHKLTQRRNK